jgi:cation diffusion facilitator CzcD-associated flavoprotein CzcO
VTAIVKTEILVVGAGVSGIGTGIGLRKAGFEDFLIVDRAHEVGGTWRDHTYPGLTVDIPSLIYSFSFEQKPDWSSLWAPQAEVLDYCLGLADKYGLRPHLRFGQEVLEARYDESDRVWRTETADGITYESRYLINASGYFSAPRLPDVPGLDGFGGVIAHSSQWSDTLELRGKQVAVIGTGASAIQLAPHVAEVADGLAVYQRTPIWLLPKPPMRFRRPLREAFAKVPGFQRVARLATSAFMDLLFFRFFTNYPQVAGLARLVEKICRAHIRRQVDDPAVRDALTPRFSWGCKRPSFSGDFYPIFNKPGVELVTAPIEKVTADGVVTSDGRIRKTDVIVCATGYQPFEKAALPTYPVRGRDGQDLREYWDENRYQAFQGYAVHGFPNFFLVFGPYSIASSSYFAMVEVAVRSIVRCLEGARSRGADYVEVTPQAQAADHAETLRRKATSVWSTANCAASSSYYVDRFGDTPGFRPTYHWMEWWASRTLTMNHFSFAPPARPVRRG